MIVQTEIGKKFTNRLKKRGLIYTSLGAILLFIGANFLTVHTMEQWGLWIFLTAIVWIYIGLKPYQEAKKRLFEPDEIHLESDSLKYFQHQKLITKIPFHDLKDLTFKETKIRYGIFAWIKTEKVFFPFFTKKSLEKILRHPALQNVVHPEQPD